MAAAFCLAAQFVNAQAPPESPPVPTYPEEDVHAIYIVAYTSPLTELKFQDDWYTKAETTTVADVEVVDDAAM
ncbi:MAG: hypothetical protein LUC45_09260, partial [Paraprevotella sp.]|nr:hypothetical protein [Paraprevotella sp.]